MSETKKSRAPVQIPVIRITNPFNPAEFVREEMTWQPTKTLADYFPLPTTSVVVSINGKIVERAQFGKTYLDKTDNMVVCPVPTGGGGSKQILSIVALIAVSMVTAGAGAAAAGAMMGTDAIGFAAAYGAVGVGVANAVVTMAGSILVHALLAPPKPTTKASATSSSYGVDGAKNTAVEGIVVPVCYGQFRMAGNILGLRVDNDSEDNQTLYMLLSAGEGPVASISSIEINDNPIEDFKDVEVMTRPGLAHQDPIPWFHGSSVPINKSQKLTQDWFYSTTTTTVDKLRLDFVAPSGLCNIDSKDGSLKTATVDVEVEYRAAGAPDSAWSGLPVSSEIVDWINTSGHFESDDGTRFDQATGQAYRENANGTVTYLGGTSTMIYRAAAGAALSAQQQAYVRDSGQFSVNADGTVSGRVPVYSGKLSISSNKRSAVRRSFTTDQLPAGKYEIRVRRTTINSKLDTVIDQLVLADVNEITVDEMTYPHTALLALKIRLTDQLSGLPKVTFLNGGRMIQVYGKPMASSTVDQWYDDASQNPAWIVWDMMTHRRYGGAMPTSRLDFVAFNEWAAYCESKNLTWNGPIDSEMNVWDAAQLPLRVGHSQLVNVGTRYTVVTEKPADAVMMFSVANMIDGSYKETWLGMTDRANEIDVTFFDKTDKFKARTVKVYDPAALTAGAKQRTSAVTLYGVTDYDTAYKEGQLQLNLNRYIQRTIAFSAPLEAIACSVGSLVYVQHDMTDWAVGGRFEAGSTDSVVKLDRDVTMEAEKQYKLLSLRDAVQRATGAVYNVAGTSLFLTGFDGQNTVKRIQVGGKDLRVAGVFDQGAGFGVIVDDATGIISGGSYTLWDTDVIEEHNVVNVPGAHDTLTLQAPMSSAPQQFVNWMFGEVEKVKKPFRIKAITGSHEYRRDITAIEYKPEVYDFGRFDGNSAILPPQAGVIGPASALSVYEETYVAGSSVVSKVVASWAAPTVGNYAGADVYVQKGDGPMVKLDEVKNRTSAAIDATKGDKVVVKIVTFDIFGKRSQYELAPQQSYSVIGEIPNIDVGGVTGVDFAWAGRDCKLNWRYNSTTHSYEFGSEPTGADAGALDPHFKDYEIRVYDKTGTVLRRTEYTTDNSYTYIYDKNFADGVTRHLVFEVRMRDIFNNLGVPAVLDAYNPPPLVTGVAAKTTFESATVSYTHSDDPDFAGARIWLSSNEADLTPNPPADQFLVYTGPDSSVLLPGLLFNRDYYYRIAAVDAFGPTELVPSPVAHMKTTYLDTDVIADGVLADSKLLPALKTRIDLIDAPATVDGSVAKRVLDEANARTQAILAEAAARGAAITTEQQTRQSATDSLASRIDTVSAGGVNLAAAIQTETTARTNADGALATQITTVATKTDNNAASITNEATARTNADSSLSTRIDTVVASTGANTAAITSETTARTNADDSLATSISQLAATVNGHTASITNEAITRANAVSSEASQRNEQIVNYDNNVRSYIQSYGYSKATADSTTNSVYSTLRSEYNNAANNAYNNAVGYVQSYGYSKAGADSAIATSVNQVSARLNNLGGVTLEQRFDAQASTNTGLSAQYSVKIDNNGYVSGFGLASTPVNGVPASEFIVNADRFAIVTAGGGEHPFTVGTVNGVTRTIIKSALIGDAAIGNAQLGNAEVGTLKIAGNAVTIPITEARYDTISGVSSYQNVMSKAITMPQAGTIQTICTCSQSSGSGGHWWNLSLRINGVEIAFTGGSAPADSTALSGSMYLGAGTHTVELWQNSANDSRVTNRNLTIMGAMR